jgi:hypothetical protein
VSAYIGIISIRSDLFAVRFEKRAGHFPTPIQLRINDHLHRFIDPSIYLAFCTTETKNKNIRQIQGKKEISDFLWSVNRALTGPKPSVFRTPNPPQTNNPGAPALIILSNSQVGGTSLHQVLFRSPSSGPKVPGLLRGRDSSSLTRLP